MNRKNIKDALAENTKEKALRVFLYKMCIISLNSDYYKEEIFLVRKYRKISQFDFITDKDFDRKINSEFSQLFLCYRLFILYKQEYESSESVTRKDFLKKRMKTLRKIVQKNLKNKFNINICEETHKIMANIVWKELRDYN